MPNITYGKVQALFRSRRANDEDTFKQYFSIFLMLQPSDRVPHVVTTPNVKLFLLLVHVFNFASVMNHTVNILGGGGLPKGSLPTE